MGFASESVKSFVGGWSVAVKTCDSCKSAAAVLFCRQDSAFLCLVCDTKIHCANKLASRHERVWMCEVCEQAPAAVTCKADAAALCVACDADIHSANPLARRHERVPVEPFFDSAESMIKSCWPFNILNETNINGSSIGGGRNEEADDRSSSWLLPNPNLNSKVEDGLDLKSGDVFFSEMDSFMEFDYPNSIAHCSGTDSVVPVQNKPISQSMINHSSENRFDINFCRSKLSSFSYSPQSLSHSLSSSSLDIGVVPDGTSMSDISYRFSRNTSSGADPAAPGPASTKQTAQLCGMDREARVLRYREKRKNRKFEKTIRYASRKAYAETRPRIKGRFAKRNEIDSEMNQMFGSGSAAFMAEAQFGVVPTF